ncbi:hypothetical protein VTN49DRAFT_5794 [Thermomyces lanuginosus]|uniref:uncharacterized protein n=1 Tax=Thermomyces lanuginosus TaxID=5541 RepID=UPI0037429475
MSALYSALREIQHLLSPPCTECIVETQLDPTFMWWACLPVRRRTVKLLGRNELVQQGLPDCWLKRQEYLQYFVDAYIINPCRLHYYYYSTSSVSIRYGRL